MMSSRGRAALNIESVEIVGACVEKDECLIDDLIGVSARARAPAPRACVRAYVCVRAQFVCAYRMCVCVGVSLVSDRHANQFVQTSLQSISPLPVERRGCFLRAR
jgi:hypothetical protein